MPEAAPRMAGPLAEAISRIPLLWAPSLVRPLAGGPASDSWLIDERGNRMVLRVDTPLARQLPLDRGAELEVLETVAAAGIGPRPLWADPAAGVLLTAYLPGETWRLGQVREPRHLAQLAATLRQLHALPACGRVFDPGTAALGYARDIGSPAAAQLAAHAHRLAGQLLAGNHRPSLCHNDLVHTNLVGFDPVFLIDWEYAAIGDPLFDLAIVARHHQLPEAVTQKFLRAALNPDTLDRPGSEIDERFRAFCELYDLLSRLWYEATGTARATDEEPWPRV